ncbi:UNVERIFIED_CONTAM: hypothetical protein FKN15_015812 [Acipenser sinensis]
MSDQSVNDHLEGILSDFEALKRSFDTDNVDDIPTFSPTSPLNSPFSPSPSTLILTKTNEGRGPTAHIQPTYQSRISISSSPAPSPVIKNKMVSSLSFNRGSMAMAKTNGNTGSSITRVSSFQTKFNPNGFSSSCGPGSDNDSLHSSTSSLEYQASSKLGSCTSPPQSPMGMSNFKAQRICSPALQKFSSHGNMFHSEAEPPLVLPAEPMGVNHGSMPSLDLRITESRGAGNARSPSMGYRSTGPTWNAASLRQNSGPLGREPSFTSGTQSPKPKDPTKLNKFPLDLDNLVAKPQEAPKEAFPRPAPRSHPKLSSPTSSTSPAVSISSLETVAAGIHSKTAKAGSMPSPGRFPVPSVSESPVQLSAPQTPQFRLVSQPQVVQLSPVAQPPAAQGKVTQKPQISEEPAQGPPPQKDSVGSILQRIASFSRADNTGGPRPRENKYHGNKQEREEPPGQREADQRMKKLEGTQVPVFSASTKQPTPATFRCTL